MARSKKQSKPKNPSPAEFKPLSEDEETKIYRIRAPKWLHAILQEAGETIGTETSKAESLGVYLASKIPKDGLIELQKVQRKIKSMEKKMNQQ